MMKQVSSMNMEKIAPLFNDWDEAMIWSCLQGYMGYAVCDDKDKPSSAMICVGVFCFFAGKPNALLFESVSNFKMLIPKDQDWERLIESHYGKRVHKILRYAIKKETDVFNVEKLTVYVNSLDKIYEMRLFDQEIFQMALEQEWSVDLCSQFQDYDDFQKRAIGVAILHQGKLVAGASPYAVYNGGMEIQIDTKPDYWQKGLASSCGAKLILECLDKKLYPSWDAHDLRSVALAEKLGYHLDKEYVTYVMIGME